MWWLIAVVVAIVAVVAVVVPAAVVVAVVAPLAVLVVAILLGIIVVAAIVWALWALIDTFLITHFDNEVSDFISECKFSWFAKYRIEELKECILQITLRIKLVFEASITEREKTDAKDLWERAIEDMWTDKFKLSRTEGDCTCQEYTVRVDVNWVESGEHHTVNVDPGSDRSNMSQWYIEDDGQTAAHEAGHMLGNPDEYAEGDVCPDRDVRDDNTIMGTGNEVKKRHYNRFGAWITHNTHCTYEV